jgi:hypothetical protein
VAMERGPEVMVSALDGDSTGESSGRPHAAQ